MQPGYTEVMFRFPVEITWFSGRMAAEEPAETEMHVWFSGNL